MKITEILDSIEMKFEDYTESTSLNLAIELHYSYRSQGFKPHEFYYYLTGLTSPFINNWSDAVIKVKNFIDEKEISNAIN